MTRIGKPLAIALALMATADPSPAQMIHVAPGGDDSAVGSEKAPMATVRGALARLRGTGSEAREVRVAPGIYRFASGLELESADSGRPGRPLKITGTGPGVVFSGFKFLSPAGLEPGLG